MLIKTAEVYFKLLLAKITKPKSPELQSKAYTFTISKVTRLESGTGAGLGWLTQVVVGWVTSLNQ